MQKESEIKANPGLEKIPDYMSLLAKGKGMKFRYNLSSNEAAPGASDKVKQAYIDQADKIFQYPAPDAGILREAIAGFYGINKGQIVCCNGSEEGLHLLARAYVSPDDEVIISQHGFIVHRLATMAAGGTLVTVPETNYRCDINAMLSSVTEKTRMLFIANPGNPTGTYLTESEIRQLHEQLPKNILLVLDAAYAEFADGVDDYECGIALIEEGAENVVVTRSFSKMYGMAGLRVGWMYCSSQSFVNLHKVRPIFSINTAAQVAACAALTDAEYVREYRKLNTEWLKIMSTRLGELGLEVTPSVANFILVHFDQTEKTADAALLYLRQQGILVTPVKEYDLPDSLRISIGMSEQNEAVLDLLKEFIQSID